MFGTLRGLLAERVPAVSLAFLGPGVLQAWIAALQAMVQAALPSDPSTAFGRVTLYVDLGSVPVFLLVVVLARGAGPLGARRGVLAGAAALMYAGNALAAFGGLLPAAPLGPGDMPILPSDTAQLGRLLGLALAGAGSSLAILCWWEVCAALNPVEVAFCCASSWIAREVAIAALSGYSGGYLVAATLVFPLLGMAMFDTTQRRCASLGLVAHAGDGAASFPWKPMSLVALYAFAYGCGTWLLHYQDDLFMRLGMVLPALVVCASILFASRHFDFALVYRTILPAAIAGFLALLLVRDGNEGLATVFVRASYTSVSLYISVVLCNLSRRYGISAAWLFGLLNVVHIAFLGAGTLLFNALPSLVVVGAVIICILFATFIIVSEPTLNSSWRIVLTRAGTSLAEDARLELTVDTLAREHGLSGRQREILLLVARGDTPRALGNKLGIAPGTVKAHMQHIYKKLGVHSKEELDALVQG